MRPGVLDVLASALRPVRALIKLDFPTFERPAKHTSIRSSKGKPDIATTPFIKTVFEAKSLRPVSNVFVSGSGARQNLTFIRQGWLCHLC